MNAFQVIGFVVVLLIGVVAIGIYTGYFRVAWSFGEDEEELKQGQAFYKFLALSLGLGFLAGWVSCWLFVVKA